MRRYHYIATLFLASLMNGSLAADEPESQPGQRLGAGDPFPHFELTNTEHETVRLHDQFEEHPILLIYYRGGW